MTADPPQRAIFDESARYHRFLEYRAGDAIDPRRAARAVAAALAAARDGVHRPARIVVAFGRRLWSALAPDAVPSDLHDFETIRGVDGHVAPATQCDLWFWLQGDGEDENVARTLALHAALRDDFELSLEQPGFTYFASRDLIDFEDGTANPKDDEARTEAAVVPDGSGAGGSIVLVQRWVHDLDKFAALDVAAQEAVIGRTKADSIELEGDDMPTDSHVSRTDVKKDGVALKVYRRSAPYATLARHGLYFLAFARARERHQIQLERMFGVSGDGLHDRLIEFSRADTGSYLFAPGERALAEVIEGGRASGA
ncbi:MAG: Dyp-type peroxidase [Thiotrichales bacterium]|nr:Dyp-type peroxidase [Thiotrichales bacterium]